ncbi:RNA polymerase sigma factor [Mucilaginibacter terrae]|uniref:RNA polymerase sigma factor (Sigma-70 family) n=1 Tax=Mucilaginibacter terrae TaxID=1955052 RepID=A0ABU3GN18_9SPHI|nr:sigma-70 family RNA polymerase sigma factor [Mucilaginibacter terrae]MDT3401178.1 RNA polymerase sigma factor (sigma-70 family) [Mucilaginibacter terrae]
MNIDFYLADLWTQTIAGDLTAYGKIHEFMYPKLYHYLKKIMDDEDLAEDLIQDLFVKVWERKGIIDQIHNVRFYFFKAARSMALNHFRWEKQHGRLCDYLTESDHAESSREEVIVQQEASRELSEKMSSALKSLPKRQQEMIVLKYYENFSYVEISSMTGIKYQSVINHVHRGVLQLRTLFPSNTASGVFPNQQQDSQIRSLVVSELY